MGTCVYCRRFIKDFSSIAVLPYGLMKKGVDFVWTKECQRAFEELKQKLMSEPILALPENAVYLTVEIHGHHAQSRRSGQ